MPKRLSIDSEPSPLMVPFRSMKLWKSAVMVPLPAPSVMLLSTDTSKNAPSAPPLSVMAPVPSAWSEPRLMVPPEMVVAPE